LNAFYFEGPVKEDHWKGNRKKTLRVKFMENMLIVVIVITIADYKIKYVPSCFALAIQKPV